MTQRLPIPGQDDGTWGNILNSYLGVSLNPDGTVANNTVGTSQIQSGAVTNAKLAGSIQTSLSSADSSLQASQLGAASGIATLDSGSHLTASQIPSSVLSASPSGGVPAWAPSTAYSLNALVTNGGTVYICNTAHTSGSTFTAEASSWTAIGGNVSPYGTITSSTQTTAFTVNSGMLGTLVGLNNASAQNVTIPSDSTLGIPFVSGQWLSIGFKQLGAGAWTVINDGTSVINGNFTTTGQYQNLMATRIAANTWSCTVSQPGTTGAGGLMALCSFTPSNSYSVTATSLTAVDGTNLVITPTTNVSGPGSTTLRIGISITAQTSSLLQIGFTGTSAPTAAPEVTNNTATATKYYVVIYAAGLTPNTSYTWQLAAKVNTGSATLVPTHGNDGPVLIEVFAGLT